jgi:2-polyprenyl-6-methoxyphenol hydroxylase-like FAD-dependent oxidoreductase
VLVGDAGYVKDPITAQGISDAFRGAELAAQGLDEWLSGRRSFDDALGDYQRQRDERAMPMYDFTYGLATLAPPPPETQQLLEAVATSQDAMDGFASMLAGTLPVTEFFAPPNVDWILGQAAARRAA